MLMVLRNLPTRIKEQFVIAADSTKKGLPAKMHRRRAGLWKNPTSAVVGGRSSITLAAISTIVGLPTHLLNSREQFA